ncbi:MAG: peptidoglycan DD-metalloendopeptidase family protein [Eubacteriales bacterium]
MNNNQKKQKLNKGIGIAIAILLALTLCVTIIAFTVSKRSKNPGTSGTTKNTNASATMPSVSSDNTTSPTTPTGGDEISFISPLKYGSVVKAYSADIPVFSLTMEDYRVHCGVDIGADVGTEVLAVSNGTISKVRYDPMMGQTIEITHDGGYVSVYKNLRTNLPGGIKEGAKVTVGDTIGYVGDTAIIEISEKPHIHFELYHSEKNVDPLTKITISEQDKTTDYED